jgi:dienelactone hydrolase
VLDVLADVRAHFPVDDEAVVISGLSMGGYGATRLGALHPDLFAAVVDWVGPSGASNTERAASAGATAAGTRLNVLDVLGNLRNTPFAGLYHGTDQLVHVDQGLAFRSRLAELRVPSMHWLHPVGPHSSDANYDDWQKEATWSARRVRATSPARVTFRTDRRFFQPHLGIAPDRAHWLSGISPAGAGYADVDAVSHGCAWEPVLGVVEGAGVGPTPWVSQEVRTLDTVARPRANRLDLTATNVRALRLDLAQACLGGSRLEIHSAVDRPVRLTLSNGRSLTLPKGTARTTVS